MQRTHAGRASRVVRQPAAGRPVGEDAVRGMRPPHAEQLGQHGLVRLDESLLVALVSAALLGGQERRAGHGRRGAGLEGGLDVRRGRRSHRRRSPGPASRPRGAPASRVSRADTVPRVCPPASTPWAMTASAPAATAATASSALPTVWIHVFGVRRFGDASQCVTTTSASLATSQCARRASGTIRFTASGFDVWARTAAISARSASGGRIPMVPSPPASETATASALRRQAATHPGLQDGSFDAEPGQQVGHAATPDRRQNPRRARGPPRS